MDELKKVSILHINTSDSWRGGEKQTFYLTSGLNQKKYLSYCICQKGSPLHQKLEEAGLPFFAIKMRSGFDILAAKKISQISRAINAKIMHSHTAHGHSLAYISNFFYKVPINIASRRVDFDIKKNFLSRLKYEFPDKFIAVSVAIKNVLIKAGIDPARISVVYSGIDLNTFKKIKTDYLFNEFRMIPDIKKKIRLVNVAALTRQKDHDTLLAAAAILKENFQDFILIIAGDGELKNELLHKKKDLSLDDHVIFTGFRNDSINLISFGDIFIMPSRYEGLGTSIIDAMAAKKPIVATDAGGIPELIGNGISGLIVSKENPEALAEAILKLILDKRLRKKIGSQAYYDSKKFSVEKTINGTIHVYRELFEKIFQQCRI